MTPTILLPTATPPAAAPEVPRTPEAMAADFIAALAAALPAVKAVTTTKAAQPSAQSLPEQAATPVGVPVTAAPVTTGLERAQVVAAAPALPTLALVANKIAVRQAVDPPVTQSKAATESDPVETSASSSIVTPDVIAALIAAMVPQSAANADATTPSAPSPVAQAVGAAPTAPTSAVPQVTSPQVTSPIAHALAMVSDKASDHSASVDVLSALVTNTEAPKPQTTPETIAVATTSSFALPSLPMQVDVAQPSGASPQPAVQIAIPVHVEHPQWGQAVGEQIVMAVHQGKHSAELRLDPPNLGPVSVQIEVSGNQAKVSFVAPVNATCDALAQSLPDLRSAFSAQGMTLAQANIEQQTHQQAGQGRASSSPGNAGISETGAEVLPMRIVTPRGIVDEYA